MQSGSSPSDSLRRPSDSSYNNSFESNPLGAGGSVSRTIWPLGSHAIHVNRPLGIGNRRWRSSTICGTSLGTSLGDVRSVGTSDGEQATAIASTVVMPTASCRSMDVLAVPESHPEEPQPSSTPMPSISATEGSFCTVRKGVRPRDAPCCLALPPALASQGGVPPSLASLDPCQKVEPMR